MNEPFKKANPGAGDLRGEHDSGELCALNYENHTTPHPTLSSKISDPAKIWREIAFLLSTTTNHATYELHFAAAQPIDADADTLIVALPTPASVAWVRTRLASTVDRAIRAAGYEGSIIDWRVK